VAEVYTLHALLLTVALGLLLAWSARQAARGRVGLLALASLTVGLALGNHLTTVILVPLGLAYAGAVGGRTVSVRGWLVVVLAFLLGLAIYAYLPLRAAHGPAANWGDPSTPERFLQHVTGADYRGYLLGRPLGQVLLRVPVVARLLVEQFTWPGIALLCLGIWDGWERLRRETALLLGIALANALFALVYNAEGSQVYLLPAYVVSALFVGLGVAWLWRLVAREAPTRWRGLALATLALGTLLMPVARAATAYGAVDASGDYEALDYALAALQAAPAGEPLYPSSDEETFPLWYAQEVLGVRPDAPIVNLRLLRLAWYRAHLAQRYPGYAPPAPGEP
jgi:hypothetical protein